MSGEGFLFKMGDFAACLMEWSNSEGNNDHSRAKDSCWSGVLCR